MRYHITISSKLHLHRIFSVLHITVCWACSQTATAQVSYDNNGTTISVASGMDMVQGAFTVPAGDDRLLTVFVIRDAENSATDSVTFNGQELTLQHSFNGGSAGLTSEINGDRIGDVFDNCPYTYQINQLDLDGDGIGDVSDYVKLGHKTLDELHAESEAITNKVQNRGDRRATRPDNYLQFST